MGFAPGTEDTVCMRVCAHVCVCVHMCIDCSVEGEDASGQGQSGSVAFEKCSCSIMVSPKVCVETNKQNNVNVPQNAAELPSLSRETSDL